MDSTPIVIESQVDWLTASAFGKDRTAYLALLAATASVGETAHGDQTNTFRLNGYEGWRCGRVRYGERENAGLIQLSGELAATWYDQVYSHADHVTRLDLAVTVETGQRDLELGRRSYEQACAYRLVKPRSARPWCVQDADGGWTTYIGDRTSDWFLRLYNKEAESIASHDDVGAGQYAKCWRWELEVKGRAAKAMAREVYIHLARSAFIRSYVHRWVADHGIEPAFPSAGEVVKLSHLRRRSDRSSRLAWLSRSVSPAVRWLMETGDRTEVLEALGLGDPD